MTYLRNVFVFAGVASSVAFGARAANVNDLANEYEGDLHHVSNPAGENAGFEFEIDSVSPNGKFNGNLEGIPMTGKVTSTGKMTFAVNGSLGNTTLKITKGKGQLSATGRFIVGSLQLKATPPIDEVPDGAYTFSVEEDVDPEALSGGPRFR